MTERTYGQFCGLARALELIGERWGLLVVRDLVLGPKRYTDLRQTLPRIPSSVLSSRLNELEQGGVVRRRVQAELDATVVYELTEYGHELGPIMLQLGRWGARSLSDPTPEHVFTLDAAILAMHATFLPEAAGNVEVTYELDFGRFVVHARVTNGVLEVGEGRHPETDLVIVASPAFRALLAGEICPARAIDEGLIQVVGDPELLTLFTELFAIAPAPEPAEGLVAH